MKKICLVMPVLVAGLMLFAATNAVAVVQAAHCDANNPDDVVRMQRGECFKGPGGFVVEIVPTGGNFPYIDTNGNSVFTYKITSTGGKSISHVDIFIPVCVENPISSSYTPCTTPPCQGTPIGPGLGESSTGFGLGVLTNSTFKWPLSGNSGQVSLTMQGTVFASPNAMLVKSGSSTSGFAYGQILAPACGLITAPTFPPQVPQTTKKEVNILGVDVCMESENQSGCPTKIYSCDIPIASVCDCPSDPNHQVVWDKKTLLDHKINLNTLFQAWTDYDSRCRKAHSRVEGSCQISTYLPDGSLYTWTYPAISGKVTNATTGKAVGGVTMQICTDGGGCNTSEKTNALGKYSLCLGTASIDCKNKWSGTVTPQKTGLSFAPVSPTTGRYTDVCGEGQQNQNYTGQ